MDLMSSAMFLDEYLENQQGQFQVIDEIIFLFFRMRINRVNFVVSLLMKLFFFYLLLVERTRKNYVELRSCIKYFLILLVELWKELG